MAINITFTTAWIVVYRDRADPKAPDADAQIFTDETDLIEQVTDWDSECCDHRVLEVLEIDKSGEVHRIRDEMDRRCKEHIHDWRGEQAHRQSLRRVG